MKKELTHFFERAVERATDITSIFFVVVAVISAVDFIQTNKNPLLDMVVSIVMIVLVCLYRTKYLDTTM